MQSFVTTAPNLSPPPPPPLSSHDKELSNDILSPPPPIPMKTVRSFGALMVQTLKAVLAEINMLSVLSMLIFATTAFCINKLCIYHSTV